MQEASLTELRQLSPIIQKYIAANPTNTKFDVAKVFPNVHPDTIWNIAKYHGLKLCRANDVTEKHKVHVDFIMANKGVLIKDMAKQLKVHSTYIYGLIKRYSIPYELKQPPAPIPRAAEQTTVFKHVACWWSRYDFTNS